MSLPKLVYVGPSDYRVREKKNHDLLGETEANITRITLRKNMSEASKRSTVVHELLHAILFESGAQKACELTHDSEERLVGIVAPWIQAVFTQDNPELLEYLTEARDG